MPTSVVDSELFIFHFTPPQLSTVPLPPPPLLHPDPSLRTKRFRLVSETEERTGFSVLAAREMKQKPKNESGGRGRGRKETLADKPLDFENLRSPANAATDWLG